MIGFHIDVHELQETMVEECGGPASPDALVPDLNDALDFLGVDDRLMSLLLFISEGGLMVRHSGRLEATVEFERRVEFDSKAGGSRLDGLMAEIADRCRLEPADVVELLDSSDCRLVISVDGVRI